MRFRTLFAVVCALGLQNAMGAGDESSKLLSEIPIRGEGGWDIPDDPMIRKPGTNYAATCSAATAVGVVGGRGDFVLR